MGERTKSNPSAVERDARAVTLVAWFLGITALVLTLAHTMRRPTPPTIESARLLDGPPVIRVQLARAGLGPWLIESGHALEVCRDGFGGPQIGAPRRRVRLEAAAGGVRVDDVVHPKIAVGAGEEDEISINGTTYRGRLIVQTAEAGIVLVLHVPLEAYMAQVLPFEMPLSYPPEALKAQCIAGRSYAVAASLRKKEAAWHLRDDETSQMFQGVTAATRRAERIVLETRHLVVIWNEKPLSAYYSANCGGRTRSNREAFSETAVAPLAGVVCDYCAWSDDYEWSRGFPLDQAAEALELKAKIRGARLGKSNPSGYETEVFLQTSLGEMAISGRRLKAALGHHRVKSTWLTSIRVERGRLVVAGRGFGHGVGLCQNGCRGLADAGKDARAILDYYYPGAVVRALEWGALPTKKP